MIISDDRQTHLAQLITDGIWKDDLVDYTDDDMAVRMAKKAIAKFVSEHEDVDGAVKKTIQNLKRGVSEGSREWDVLYSKYFEEELKRRGM